VIDRIQIVALAVSVTLLVAVLELARRRKLTEEYSIVWIASSLALLALSIRREMLDSAARWLGVFYPPILLLLALIVMVFIASLCFSVIVSRQRQQIERLIEETAVMAAEIRELRATLAEQGTAENERQRKHLRHGGRVQADRDRDPSRRVRL
jgi:hypothetical protein